MVSGLVVVLAMLVFALMPSDGLAAGGAPALGDTGVPWCAPPAIAAGVVAWWEGRRLRAFLPRSRRLLSWAVASGRFALTAHRVWLVKDGRLFSARAKPPRRWS